MSFPVERSERIAAIDRVRHELARPLTAIRACAELLEDGLCGPLTDDQRRQVEHVVVNAERMTREIDRLHALLSHELGRGEARLALADVTSLCVASARDACERHGLALDAIAIDVDEDGTALADERQLRSALAELFDNAILHGGSPGVRLSVALAPETCRITITDAGEGLAEEEIERAFDPFTRGRRSDNAKGMGIGLGLARAHVQAMGGRLGVEPGREGGTVFSVTLPRG